MFQNIFLGFELNFTQFYLRYTYKLITLQHIDIHRYLKPNTKHITANSYEN